MRTVDFDTWLQLFIQEGFRSFDELDAGGHSVFVPGFPRLPLHSRRFGRPSRWEAQITQMYGEVAGDNVMDFDYGWMAMAQDRCSWGDAAKAFRAAVRMSRPVAAEFGFSPDRPLTGDPTSV